jgi:hypothetical protein
LPSLHTPDKHVTRKRKHIACRLNQQKAERLVWKEDAGVRLSIQNRAANALLSFSYSGSPDDSFLHAVCGIKWETNRKTENKTAENKLLETGDQVPWGIVLQTDILI